MLFIEPSEHNRFCLCYFAVCAERKYLGCDRGCILRDPLLNLLIHASFGCVLPLCENIIISPNIPQACLVHIVNVYNYNFNVDNYMYHNEIDINMSGITISIMELKRVNVVIDEDAHQVLLDFQKSKGYASKDKALAELLREFKTLWKAA